MLRVSVLVGSKYLKVVCSGRGSFGFLHPKSFLQHYFRGSPVLIFLFFCILLKFFFLLNAYFNDLFINKVQLGSYKIFTESILVFNRFRKRRRFAATGRGTLVLWNGWRSPEACCKLNWKQIFFFVLPTIPFRAPSQ